MKLLQHAALQTQAFDLGIFANVLWNTSRGRWFFDGIRGVNHLGDHFSPLLAVLAPAFRLWNDAGVLLVIQSAALSAALPFAYLLGRRVTGRRDAGVLLAVWLAFLPFLHRVSRFDFHETALGVPLILGALAAWHGGRRRAFWVSVGALLLLREDYGFLLAGLGFSWVLGGDRKERRVGAFLAVGGILWSLTVIFILMPLFHSGGQPLGFSYGHLGSGPGEMILSLFRPRTLWNLTLGSGVRRETLAGIVLWTGGLVLLSLRYSPAWLAPVLLQFLSGRDGQIRLEAHYAAGMIPFLVYAAAFGLRAVLDHPWVSVHPRAVRAALIAIGTGTAVIGFFAVPPYFHPVPVDRKGAAAVLPSIPPEASVQASANLVPHLCLRKTIWMSPDSRRTEWVVLDRTPVGFSPPLEVLEESARFAGRNAAYRVYSRGGIEIFRFPFQREDKS